METNKKASRPVVDKTSLLDDVTAEIKRYFDYYRGRELPDRIFGVSAPEIGKVGFVEPFVETERKVFVGVDTAAIPSLEKVDSNWIFGSNPFPPDSYDWVERMFRGIPAHHPNVGVSKYGRAEDTAAGTVPLPSSKPEPAKRTPPAFPARAMRLAPLL